MPLDLLDLETYTHTHSWIYAHKTELYFSQRWNKVKCIDSNIDFDTVVLYNAHAFYL